MTKVLGKANDFIRGEEFDKAASSKQSEGDGKEKDKEKHKSKKDKRHDGSDRREESNTMKKSRERKSDCYHNYTPFTILRSGIYEMHKRDDKWQRPKKMFYKSRDKTKWCEFSPRL